MKKMLNKFGASNDSSFEIYVAISHFGSLLIISYLAWEFYETLGGSVPPY
jgi:hypothetical protein